MVILFQRKFHYIENIYPNAYLSSFCSTNWHHNKIQSFSYYKQLLDNNMLLVELLENGFVCICFCNKTNRMCVYHTWKQHWCAYVFIENIPRRMFVLYWTKSSISHIFTIHLCIRWRWRWYQIAFSGNFIISIFRCYQNKREKPRQRLRAKTQTICFRCV